MRKGLILKRNTIPGFEVEAGREFVPLSNVNRFWVRATRAERSYAEEITLPIDAHSAEIAQAVARMTATIIAHIDRDNAAVAHLPRDYAADAEGNPYVSPKIHINKELFTAAITRLTLAINGLGSMDRTPELNRIHTMVWEAREDLCRTDID